MRALVFDEFGAPPEVRTVPEPDCPDDGVVIAVQASGLCRSDWHAWSGHDPDVALPHVPGHEFAGVVDEVGRDVHDVHVGQRVTVPFVCACGRCASCRAGAGQVCENQFQPGFTAWGSFADRVAIPRADLNVVPLPDDLDFVAAAGLGCRFATAYHAVTSQAELTADDTVLVIGCGGVGLAAVMIAASRGARVVAVDVSVPALDLARRFGAHDVVRSADPAAAVRASTGGGVDVSIDALGSAATCRAAVESLRPRGRHVQVGLLVGADANTAVPMDQVVARELEIRGSHGMPAHAYPAMLAEIGAGRLRPDLLVTARRSLADLAGPDGALARMSTASPTGTQVVVFDQPA